MTFQEDYKFHAGTLYLSYWNRLECQVNPNMIFENRERLKLRVFDHFFENLYVNNDTHYTYIANENYIPNCKSLKTTLSLIRSDRSLFTSLQVDPYGRKNLLICGHYYTNTHLVLCGPPDARTLVKSFNNNPKNTISKLINLVDWVDPAEEIMRLALKLCS